MTTSKPQPSAPRALILKGGGVKGLAFAGAVRELEEFLPFDIFVGTSAGAIAAVLLAAGYTGKELGEELGKKDFRDFISDPWPRRIWGGFTKGGIFSGEPIRNWVSGLLRLSFEKNQRDLPPEIKMKHLPKRAVVFASKRPEGPVVFDSEGDHDDTAADLAVRYSMSIPFYFWTLKHDDTRVYDGGVLSNFPLEVFLEKLPTDEFVALYLADDDLAVRKSTSKLRELCQLFLEGRERAVVDKHRKNVVVMNPSPIRTTQFDLTADEKEFLLAEGTAAALRFLAAKNPEWVTAEKAERARNRAEELRTRVSAAASIRRRHRKIRLWVAAAGVLVALVSIGLGAKYWFNQKSAGGTQPSEISETPGNSNVEPTTGSAQLGTDQPEEAPYVVPSWFVDPSKLTEMQLRQYAGQLFLIGFESRFRGPTGLSLDGLAVARALIEQHGISGVILFKGNVPPADPPAEKRQRLITLTDELQRLSLARDPGVPMIVATDQEGGSTQALPGAVVTEMPAAMALGGLRRRGPVQEVSRMIGKELHLLGVNVNLAPVVDVNINQDNDLIRDRSFGGDPDFVSDLARAWLRGADEAGVLSVAKHFPGHGSTNEGIERPREIPVSSHRSDQLKSALKPFSALAHEGIAAIMTSHMQLRSVSQLHGNVTFDKAVLDLLRRGDSRVPDIEPIGFEGVAITDDLGLPSVAPGIGVTYVRGVSSNVLRAFEAGHDLLMVAHIDNSTPPVADYDEGGQQKGLTLAEFDQVMAEFEHYVFEETNDEAEHDRRIGRFREALARVFALKRRLDANLTNLPPATDRAIHLEGLRNEHSRRADELFRLSFATLPQGSPCPSFQLGMNDRMLLVFPVRGVQGGLDRAKAERRYAALVERERRSWLLLQSFDRSFADRTTIHLELEEYLPQSQHYERRAREIAVLVRRERPKIALFVVVNTNHAQQLANILRHLATIRTFDLSRVVVVVTGQPNVLSALTNQNIPDLTSQPTYLFAYTGWKNSVERADRLFAETLASLNPGECPGAGSRPPIYIPGINDTPSWQLED